MLITTIREEITMDIFKITQGSETMPIDLLHVILLVVVVILMFRLFRAGQKLDNQEDRSLNSVLGISADVNPVSIKTACPKCGEPHTITGQETHVVLK